MTDRIPIAFQNTLPPKVFKDVMASFIYKHKDNIRRFPIILAINNDNGQNVIAEILPEIPYIKDILYKDELIGKISFHRLLCKMMQYKSDALIFIPEGYICRKSLTGYVDYILRNIASDDTIGAFYLGEETIEHSKISGKKIIYKPIRKSAFYETSLKLQFLPFLIPTHILEGMLPFENDEVRIHKWYDSEKYRTFGIKGGCFRSIK